MKRKIIILFWYFSIAILQSNVDSERAKQTWTVQGPFVNQAQCQHIKDEEHIDPSPLLVPTPKSFVEFSSETDCWNDHKY